MSASPRSGFRRPARILRVVDLPAPFGPSRDTFSPHLIWKVRPLNASVVPNLLWIPSRSMQLFSPARNGLFEYRNIPRSK